MQFVVTDVLGQGGSCIVYNGYYLNNINAQSTVRIKECYPYKLHLQRDNDNGLLVPDNEKKAFAEYKARTAKSFEVANELHESSGLTNLTSNLNDNYEAKNTVYIVSSYMEGHTLADTDVESLGSAIRITASVLKGDLAVRQSKALIRTFKQMKDYIVENQNLINQRDYLQLSLVVAEHNRDIKAIKSALSTIDNEVAEVVDRLGNVVHRPKMVV